MPSSPSSVSEAAAGEAHAPTRVSYRRLLAFFVPLAATPFLISSTHNIINAALARLPSPELTLAIFSVVKSFSNAIKAPALMSGQITTAMADSRQSYRLTNRFVWTLGGFFFLVLVVLGYTPLGGAFLRGVMGLTDPEAISLGYQAMRITAFLPLAEVLRDSNRGILIARQRTGFVSAATFTRLVVIVAFIVWMVATGLLPGIQVAALTWAGGIGVEGLFVFGSLFLLFGSPMRAAEGVPSRSGRTLSVRYVLGFFLPLAVMMIVRGTLQPLVQAGIARGAASATRALAVYGVTWALVLNVIAPLQLLHNTSLVYAPGRDHPSWRRVFWFCIATGGFMSGVLLLLGLTPLGYVVFERILGVSREIAAEASQAVLAFSLLPLFWGARESYWGVMMRRHRTRGIGVGKVVNIAAVAFAMVVLFVLVRDVVWIPPSVVGALSLSFGELVETVLVIRLAVREDESEAAADRDTR